MSSHFLAFSWPAPVFLFSRNSYLEIYIGVEMFALVNAVSKVIVFYFVALSLLECGDSYADLLLL